MLLFICMLSPAHRLTKRKDFDALFKKGRVFFGRHVQLRAMRRTEEGAPTRFAVIVSAKAEKTAVRRNRTKRQVREILRAAMPTIRPGFDVAVSLRGPFVRLEFDEKKSSMEAVLKKARLVL